jgi:hypothetical protein
MPYPQRFRLALWAALVAKPFAPLVEALESDSKRSI